MSLTRPIASQITYISDGGVSATDLQNAIAELDAESIKTDNLASSAGASLVGHMPNGIGAIATTVHGKLGEWVSVFDFMTAAQIADVRAGTGTLDVSAAVQAATNTGSPVMFPPGSFKVSGITYTGRVIWKALGNVKLLSDTIVLSVSSGSGTVIDGFELKNITTPYVVTRNHESWSSVGAVSRTLTIANNSVAYQPTENDFYDGVWASLTQSQQSQNIGPTISLFTSDFSSIKNITGDFVVINIHNSSYCEVSGCNFRAGKGFAAGINFWNAEIKGYGNKATGNVVRYPSYSGIAFCGNYDGQIIGNFVIGAGESGIKTYQNSSGGSDFRCYRMQIEGNTTKFSVYDGFDISTDYPHTGSIDVAHQVIGNRTYNNRRVGFWGDGNYCQIQSNYARQCGLGGFVLATNYSAIISNRSDDCNSSADALVNHLQIDGSNNIISNNFVRRGASASGYAVYAPNTNTVLNNLSVDGTIFLGIDGAVTSVSEGNIDVSTGKKTTQCFQLVLLNNGGVINHLIKQDSVAGGYGSLSNRIANSTSTLSVTPVGTDASTPFVGGVKVGSASSNRVYLDTAGQFINKTEVIAVVDLNETGTAVTVAYGIQTININGITIDRPTLEFRNAVSGVPFAINSTNIPIGKGLGVKVLGRLS